LVTTFVFYRHLRRNEHGKLLINLSISLICLYVIFIIAGLVTPVEGLCGLVSALFQYFMLVFFGWTAAEAVNLYYKLVRVLGKPIEHYVLKAALIVWCKLSMNILLIQLIHYMSHTSSGSHSHCGNFCWARIQALRQSILVSSIVENDITCA